MSPYPPDRPYLIGVSGGRDSMALLHALHDLGFSKLVICHFDHGLRPASRELKIVEKSAAALGYPLELGEADTRLHAKTRRLSVETAARDLRFRFFAACADARRCHTLFLAHHADDQVETVLHHVFRGTGLAGLSGMAPVSTFQVGGPSGTSLTLLRPLLDVSGAGIAAYVAERKIAFCDDPTNSDPAHTRNRLRHSVLPVIIETMGPSSRSAILRLSKIARDEESFLASQVPAAPAHLDTKALQRLHPALRRRQILNWLREHHIEEPGFAEVEAIASLLDHHVSKVNLPKARHARRRAGKIFIE
ncbi:MAG: tRNA lysidine(34) synthetase TilS [Terrimicrobiaceae bacterium]